MTKRSVASSSPSQAIDNRGTLVLVLVRGVVARLLDLKRCIAAVEEALGSALLVVDDAAQCAEIGELHHGMAAGFVAAAVHAELHELAAGLKAGRMRPEEIAIFDSTGTALQDVVAAVAVYRRALAGGEGIWIDFTR